MAIIEKRTEPLVQSDQPCKTQDGYTLYRRASRWPSGAKGGKFASGILALAMATMLTGLTASHAEASSSSKFLVPQKSINAPAGFTGICAKYNWVCAQSASSNLSANETLRLAKAINRQVNRQVRQIDDQAQYGREELWTLPTARGGDCEDLVLLKKKMLLERGVPSEDLLIATVLDHKLRSHAVLVLRTASGDLVLDSLKNKIVPWKQTGYTFLKLQNPNSLNQWQAVLAGGVIKDRPTASR
ncbi:transglutaminase-like cysteine peptidase [uncultured Roseobacter sp.]|uniref:transglutaminase-like cysteine peptidase n=2 Tax=Roseobacter TaxID=2433 RepID=UPI00260D1A6E|nr:transglutaminase-like cysteine peptidase [uncultured Roseobacter sp.]